MYIHMHKSAYPQVLRVAICPMLCKACRQYVRVCSGGPYRPICLCNIRFLL